MTSEELICIYRELHYDFTYLLASALDGEILFFLKEYLQIFCDISNKALHIHKITIPGLCELVDDCNAAIAYLNHSNDCDTCAGGLWGKIFLGNSNYNLRPEKNIDDVDVYWFFPSLGNGIYHFTQLKKAKEILYGKSKDGYE